MTERRLDCPHPRIPEERLSLKFPDLPVTDALDELSSAINDHQVVVVVGETGSGKTTQLPKVCLALGRGQEKSIAHTQPRRLAARSVAARISEELESPLGGLCGYQVRFQQAVSEHTAVKLMTDGLLLAEFRGDPLLSRYDTLIIDEAHERSLNIDFLLGIVKTLLPKRPDLKVIITSATINYERFSGHFNQAPVIFVSGRTYPVELRYAPMSEMASEAIDGTKWAQAIVRQIQGLRQRDRELGQGLGDILVFLPGEREIREVSQFLRRAAIDRLDVLPLYARLGNNEQQRIFSPSASGLQRIVLATNVAETSLTVPGIRYVIDSGVARISRYAPRSRLQRLPIEAISQASANQRAGRCGRTEPGLCVRLYSEDDFQSRSPFTDPEIQRTNLAAVVLQCLDLGLGNPEAFPFVDPPEASMVRDGYNQLKELGLISGERLTALGKRVAGLPLDPRIGRMLLAGVDRKVFWEVSVIAAALSIQDPREAGFEMPGVSDEQSEFVTWLNLWRQIEAAREELSHSKFRAWCQEHHLHAQRVREWRETHRQIVNCFKDQSQGAADAPLDRVGLHIALLTGFATQIGRREEADYLGIRNRRFRIPKGAVAGKAPWVMAAELVETHRVVARTVAVIDPQWVIQAVPSLLKYSQSEPHWSKRQGRALCYQSSRLFGLTLIEKQTTGLAQYDRHEARRLFLREGVIAGAFNRTLPFMEQNCAIFEEASEIEAKLRRSDALLEPDELVGWFDERIPSKVLDQRGLWDWWKHASARDRDRLNLSLSDVIRSPDSLADPRLFPERIALGHLELPTEYRFKPGADDDGVAVKVPLSALMQLQPAQLEWTVPGALNEKAEALVRGLPKQVRRQLVPIPDFVAQALPMVDAQKESLTDGLARLIRHRTGIQIDPDAWPRESVADRLKIRIEVIAPDGRVLDADRDLRALQDRLKNRVQVETPVISAPWSDWPSAKAFAEFEETQSTGVSLKSYPGLKIEEGRVVECVQFDPIAARVDHGRAVAHLLMEQTAEQFRWLHAKEPNYQKACVLWGADPKSDRTMDPLMIRGLLSDTDLSGVRTETEFSALKLRAREGIVDYASKTAVALIDASSRLVSLRKRLTGKIPPAWIPAITAMKQDLARLDDPLTRVSPDRWNELPRWIQGVEMRLEKLSSRLLLDAQWQKDVDSLWSELKRDWPNVPEQWEHQDPNLLAIRWQIEEFRVLCFAQPLKRGDKVSMKRILDAFKDFRSA